MDMDAVVHDLMQPLTSILLTAQTGLLMIDRAGSAVNVGEIRGLLDEVVTYGLGAQAMITQMRRQ
jgi:hypothetical protein